jgi:iron complex outermembrane receptor protein
MTMKRSALCIFAITGSAVLHAQTESVPASEDTGLQEIVVTAQKRAQNVQDIAATVTAFNPDMLEKSGINDAVALQLKTPGLVVSTNGSYGQPYIRGVGSDIINPGTDAPVAIFIDGAYQPRPTAAITEFLDVDRVEVLKGPQGTLYGRNATGGAINIVSHAPEQRFGADSTLIYGNYDQMTFRGALNAPVTDDAAARVSAFYTEHDGLVKNLLDGKRLDDEKLWGLRGALKIDPSDAFSISLLAEYTRERDSRNLSEKVIDSPNLPMPVRDLAPLFGYAPPVIPGDPREVNADFPQSQRMSQTRLNATMTWKLGSMELKSITGFTRVRTQGILDLDGTEIPFSYDREIGSSRSIFQSLQLNSATEASFQWITGLEYLREKASQNFDGRLPFFGPPSDIPFGYDSPVAGFIWDSGIRTNAASAFVDGRWEFVPKWTLTGGVRYSWEDKDATFSETLIDPLGFLTGTPGTVTIPAEPHRKFRAWTPKAGIEFRPVADTLLYLTATRGFKSGGFNLMNTGETFDPEKIWSYETGVRSSWLDRRLRANLSAFYYDYQDLQVNQFSGITNLITNAARSRIKGVEMQIDARPVSAVGIDAALAWLDATYSHYLTRDANLPGAPEVDLSGNEMPKAPRFTATLGVDLNLPVQIPGRITLRGEGRYQSSLFFDQFNAPQLEQGGYTILNARAAYLSGDARWELVLFGRNLTDKVYRQSMVRVDNVLGTVAFFGAPRMYGAEVHYRF